MLKFYHVTYQLVQKGLPIRIEEAIITQDPLDYKVAVQSFFAGTGDHMLISHFLMVREIDEKTFLTMKTLEPKLLEIDPFA